MQRMRTPEEMMLPQLELDRMDRENFDPTRDDNRRIAQLEAALRVAKDYIEQVGDYGEGGTSDHAVALDAVRTALQESK